MATFNILSRLAGGYAAAADEKQETERKATREQRLGISNVLSRMLGDENLTPEAREAIGRDLMQIWSGKKGKVTVDLGKYGFQGMPEQAEAAPPAGPASAVPPPPAPEGVTPAPQAPSPEAVTNLYLTPEQIQNRAAARVRAEAEARARGTAAGTPERPTAKQSNFNFLVKGGMDEELARKVIFGLSPGEKPEPWDKAVFTNDQGNLMAIYFTADGIKKEVNLGKAQPRAGAAETFTAAERNFRKLTGLGVGDTEARQLAFGLTSNEKNQVTDLEFATRILAVTKSAFGDQRPRSIKRALDEIINLGLPPGEQITPEQVSAWLRSGRGTSVPPPPDEGEFETRSYQGNTYQRRRGSNDEWKLVEK